jgi:hypothetical protein
LPHSFNWRRYSRKIPAWFGHADPNRERVFVPEMGGHIDILADPEISMAMNFDAAKGLMLEIKEANRRVAELLERKHSLGLK